VDKDLAHEMEVAQVDNQFRILGFQKKPEENIRTTPEY
jgi:ADP-glucose pyrophosphorylase